MANRNVITNVTSSNLTAPPNQLGFFLRPNKLTNLKRTISLFTRIGAYLTNVRADQSLGSFFK